MQDAGGRSRMPLRKNSRSPEPRPSIRTSTVVIDASPGIDLSEQLRWRESGTPSSNLYLNVVIDDQCRGRSSFCGSQTGWKGARARNVGLSNPSSSPDATIFAAYMIRKLVEANKISDDVTGRNIVVIEHPLSGRVPDVMSYERIWKNYDLQAGVECTLSLIDLCNQIIHSFNWTIVRYEPGGLGGIFVSSDRARRKTLYFVDIVLFIVILREIGYDDVVEIQMKRDANGQMQAISLLGADTRTARYEWLMTSRSHGIGKSDERQQANERSA